MDLSHYGVAFRDVAHKVKNRVRRKLENGSVFNTIEGKSDSEITFYVEQIQSLLVHPQDISNFRRKYDYREILEHVTFKLGKEYLDILRKNHPETINDLIYRNLRNDSFGNPFTYKYSRTLRISPTTLRYIYTALDIKNTVGLNGDDVIAEIGVGYGGQAAVLETFGHNGAYHAFDLPEVIELSNIFLDHIGSHVHFEKYSVADIKFEPVDLVISNYAFSELHRDLQLDYLRNLLSDACRGYMIMNSGRTNKTGRSLGKMTVDEIKRYLPKLQVKEEIPLTGPDNFVIYWNNLI